MDAKHELGGGLAISLNQNDLDNLEKGRACEPTDPPSSGLKIFLIRETHQYVNNADAALYNDVLGVYVHAALITSERVRSAQEEDLPIVTIQHKRIRTQYESAKRVEHFFGATGEIVVVAPIEEN